VRLIYLCLMVFTSYLFADEAPSSNDENIIVLAHGQVHEGNYFAMGRSVEISGQVNGDVYVLAEQVIIDGIVNGDVLSCSGSIDISGKVLNNCRLVGGQVLISGQVGKSVTAVAGNLQLLSSASIDGSLVATAGNVDLAANIGTDATVVASNLRLSSSIGQNLQGYVGRMRVTSRAVIGGNVDYRSSAPAWIESGAVIRGKVNHHSTFVHGLVKGTWIQGLLVGSKVLAVLMNFIYTIVVGIVLVRMFPKNLEAALRVLHEHPLKALSYGIVLLALLPLAALILLMTILGVPFALTLLATTVVFLYTAKVYSIFWVSNWAFGKIKLRPNRLPTFFLGTVIYFCLAAIPIFGYIIAFAAMLFGLGAGALAQTRRGLFSA
jgi:cytoskeletal protein CcmA (bactofilin family)